MFVISKLFKPLNYWRLKHPEKLWFDLILPSLVSLACTYLLFSVVKINLIGSDGLINLVNGLLQILSGFYIASLAAVSTFQKEGMDDVMKGSGAIKLKGNAITRRTFLSYMFGYLAIASIFMYLVGGLVMLLANEIKSLTPEVLSVMTPIALFIYIFFFFNIVFTTVLGMHFLIDRINRVENTLND